MYVTIRSGETVVFVYKFCCLILNTKQHDEYTERTNSSRKARRKKKKKNKSCEAAPQEQLVPPKDTLLVPEKSPSEKSSIAELPKVASAATIAAMRSSPALNEDILGRKRAKVNRWVLSQPRYLFVDPALHYEKLEVSDGHPNISGRCESSAMGESPLLSPAQQTYAISGET